MACVSHSNSKKHVVFAVTKLFACRQTRLNPIGACGLVLTFPTQHHCRLLYFSEPKGWILPEVTPPACYHVLVVFFLSSLCFSKLQCVYSVQYIVVDMQYVH